MGEAGIAGTTLQRVGERVGLSKGALYYYVDSRDGLLTLILDDVLTAIRQEAEDRASQGASPLERLVCFARAHASIAGKRPAGQLIVSSVDMLATDERSASLLHHHEAIARQIVRQAVDAGELRPVEPVVATAVLFGALNTLLRSYDASGPLTLDTMIESCLDLLLHGWAASG